MLLNRTYICAFSFVSFLFPCPFPAFPSRPPENARPMLASVMPWCGRLTATTSKKWRYSTMWLLADNSLTSPQTAYSMKSSLKKRAVRYPSTIGTFSWCSDTDTYFTYYHQTFPAFWLLVSTFFITVVNMLPCSSQWTTIYGINSATLIIGVNVWNNCPKHSVEEYLSVGELIVNRRIWFW